MSELEERRDQSVSRDTITISASLLSIGLTPCEALALFRSLLLVEPVLSSWAVPLNSYVKYLQKVGAVYHFEDRNFHVQDQGCLWSIPNQLAILLLSQQHYITQ